MTELKNQPTKMPTRKLLAVIVATFVVQGSIGVLDYFMPGVAKSIPAADYIALLVPLVAGYAVRDRA